MANSSRHKYTDIIFEVKGKIGIIKFNRPKSLNSFGGALLYDVATALRELNDHPDTVFTVITGEGRFFCAGADVKAAASRSHDPDRSAMQKKIDYMASVSTALALEILRSMIDHRKVLVIALNGPAVGGGVWFPSVADIVLAAEDTYLQVPFSALGLVPEYGTATNLARSMGVQRANDFLMFGRKVTAQELEQWGLVNRIFPKEGFPTKVLRFLEEQLRINDGKSMMEAKSLQNLALRRERMLAVYDAADALAERFGEDAPTQRFAEKNRKMQEKSKARSKL